MTGMLSSFATLMHALANFSAASFVLSACPDGSSPQRSLPFIKSKLTSACSIITELYI
jgi:hypothetical protein